MKTDRRTFARGLALGVSAGIIGIPRLGWAAPGDGIARATLIVDAATGKVLHRSGGCATRLTPCSTFKIPLALIGFDAGILQDAHNPAWDYRPGVTRASRPEEKQRTDPTTWESNSVVWFSQELTRRLGPAKFKAYVDRFGYGNRDVSGNPGKNDGLTQAWLGSSLAISPDEQVAFLRRMLAHKLVSARAHAEAEAIIPVFEGKGGWTVHGKTGSGAPTGDDSRRLGWFVGWADKGGRRIVFARAATALAAKHGSLNGPVVRSEMLEALSGLAG